MHIINFNIPFDGVTWPKIRILEIVKSIYFYEYHENSANWNGFFWGVMFHQNNQRCLGLEAYLSKKKFKNLKKNNPIL